LGVQDAGEDPLPSPLLWPQVLQLAREHRVLPVVYPVIARSPGIPAPLLREAAQEVQNLKIRSLSLLHHLLSLLQQCQEALVPVLPLKGPVLAWQIYGDPALRPSVDLDLLVRPEHLDTVVSLLESQGYRLPEKTRRLLQGPHREYYLARTHHLVLYSQTLPPVELHLRLMDPRWRFTLREEDVWARSRTLEISGIPVRVLSEEDLVLYLLLHGGKHAWNRWIWLVDVHQAVQTFSPTLHWPTLEQRAQAWGGLRLFYLGVALAHQVLRTPVPPTVLRRAGEDPGVRRFLPSLQIPKVPQAPGFWTRIHYEAWMRSRGRWDWMIYWLQWLGERIVSPTEKDLDLQHVPSTGWAFLYRPLRILKDLKQNLWRRLWIRETFQRTSTD